MSGAVSIKPKAPFKPVWATELADGTVEIGLPQTLHTRPGAVMLVAAIDGELNGRTVLLDARTTTLGTETFAEELLAQLHQRGVAAVLLTPTAVAFEAALVRFAAAQHLPLQSVRLNGEIEVGTLHVAGTYC